MSTQDKQLIFSVKHSGTRSLRKHIPSITGWTHYPDDMNYGGELVDTGEWLADKGMVHFGDGSWRKMLQWEGRVDIPIRNPMAVAQSWAGRYGMSERTITDVLQDLTEMIDYIGQRPDAILHKIEDLGIIEGHEPLRPERVLSGSAIKRITNWCNKRQYFYDEFGYKPGVDA